MITIELLGEPKGKGRPRFMRKTGIAYTPQPTRNYEAALRMAAQLEMARSMNSMPLDGPVKVTVTAYFTIPKSWPKAKQERAILGVERHTTKPDWENIAKCCDALNGVVWLDDKQVAEGTVVKLYGDRPRLKVEVSPL